MMLVIMMMIQLDFDLLYPVIVVVELNLKMILMMVMANLIVVVVDEYYDDDAVKIFVAVVVEIDAFDDTIAVSAVAIAAVDNDDDDDSMTLIPNVDVVKHMNLILMKTLYDRYWMFHVNVDNVDANDADLLPQQNSY